MNDTKKLSVDDGFFRAVVRGVAIADKTGSRNWLEIAAVVMRQDGVDVSIPLAREIFLPPVADAIRDGFKIWSDAD